MDKYLILNSDKYLIMNSELDINKQAGYLKYEVWKKTEWKVGRV